MMTDIWRTQRPERRKCGFCKEQRPCKHGPDPFLYYQFDEIEMVWLCEDCFGIRRNGKHLPDDVFDGEEWL